MSPLSSPSTWCHSSYNRMSEVMARMEERGRNQETSLVAMEKDLALKQQAMDTLRAKVGLGM